jgi:hypothetical protein
MITVIVPWDEVQMPASVEWQLWRQLKGAFSIDRFIFVPNVPEVANLAYDHVDTMEEALALSTGEKVFLEAGGTKGMNDIPAGDVVLIVGNTGISNAEHAQADELYSINTLGVGAMYGVNAAAIALAFKAGQ